MYIDCMLFVPFQGQTRFQINYNNFELKIQNADNTFNHLFNCNFSSPTCHNYDDVREYHKEIILDNSAMLIRRNSSIPIPSDHVSYMGLGDGMYLQYISHCSMQYLFRFVNPNMEVDLTETHPKTGVIKIVSHKEINVCSDTEENARIKAYRTKIDGETNNTLSKEWVLVKQEPLNKDWSCQSS